MIELAAAVVRHIDHINAVLHGKLGVFRRGDALEDQRHATDAFNAVYRVPRQGRLKLGAGVAGWPPRFGEAGHDVAFAAAVERAVHGEAKRREAVVARARDPVVHPVGVAAHVELKHAQCVCGCGSGFETRLTH